MGGIAPCVLGSLEKKKTLNIGPSTAVANEIGDSHAAHAVVSSA